MARQSKYKLVYAKKAELSTRRGEIIFLTSEHDAARYSLTPDQFALAQLFDGNRSIDEIHELYTGTTGVGLQKTEFLQFVTNLEQASLLQDTAAAVRDDRKVVNRSHFGNARPRKDTTAPHAGDISHLPNSLWPRDDGEPDERSGYRPAAEEFASGQTEDEQWIHGEELASSDSAPGARRARKTGFAEKFGQPLKLLVRIPIGWLMPIAYLLTLPVRSRVVLALVLGTNVLAGFGLWFNRVEMAQHLSLLFDPLTLAQVMLIGMFSVNLLGQLARTGTAVHYSGKRPPFGIIMAFNLLPRFYASLSEHHGLLSIEQRRGIVASSLYVNFVIFGASSFLWLATKANGTFLSQLFIGIAALSVSRFVLGINPLAKRAGYILLSARLGIPLLRERALLALVSKAEDMALDLPGTKPVSVWALRLYGLLVLVWLASLATLVTIVAGGWLEAHWGGLGVIVFVSLAAISLYSPLKQASTFRQKYQKLQRATRSRGAGAAAAPAPKSTLGSRLIMAAGLVALVVVSMLPYTYEPGGPCELLPLPERRVDVRSQIEAQIDEIFVSEGEKVAKGQLLARLVDNAQQKDIAVTEATLQQLNAQLTKAQAGPTKEEISAAEQRVQTAQTNYRFTIKQSERYKNLFQNGTVSEQEYEEALAKADNDREQLSQARKNLELLLAGVRLEEIEEIKAQMAEKTAELEYDRQRLSDTELRAPIPGEIASGSLLTAAGGYLERGDLFTVIEDNSKLLAEIRLPQANIGEVRQGAPVRIKTWTYPDREFYGVVQSIAPAADDSAYGKVVRVMTEIDNSEGLLKTNLTGQAKIVGEQKTVFEAFTRMLVRFFYVELWSWLP